MIKTPFLVNCDYDNFEEYLLSLSKSSRWNYRDSLKKKPSLQLSLLTQQTSLVNKNKFEKIWSDQMVYGKKAGAFSIQNKSNTKILGFHEGAPDELLALQVVEFNKNYVYAHMPMYDKSKTPDISKLCWFLLAKYVVEKTEFKGIDLGGVCGRSAPHSCGEECDKGFRRLVLNRDLLDKYKYKFLFLPKKDKNPKTCTNYMIVDDSLVDYDEFNN